jgi:hypothetical protein
MTHFFDGTSFRHIRIGRVLSSLFVLLLLASAGCASMQSSSSGASEKNNARAIQDCGSCMRLCEVGGSSKGQEDAVEGCKKRCKETCKE